MMIISWIFLTLGLASVGVQWYYGFRKKDYLKSVYWHVIATGLLAIGGGLAFLDL